MVAQANEEQEALATQLYETGHALDEATAEVCVWGGGGGGEGGRGGEGREMVKI